MISKTDVAASVILYNSHVDCINDIKSYYNQVNKVYIIDNSDSPNLLLIEYFNSIDSVEYHSNQGNKGVANALNKAASLAIKDGFSYLLTMDDDSQVPEQMVAKMLCFINRLQENRVGILSVAHSKPAFGLEFKYVNYTMTSGNLLSLYAYKQVGSFDEKLFIDYVDHEYNFRLKSEGFVTIELAALKLNHKLGTEKTREILGYTVAFVSHSPLRLYYLVRNSIYIMKKYILIYPILCITLSGLTLKETIKSFTLEDNKFMRIKYFGRAIRDGFLNKMGKLID